MNSLTRQDQLQSHSNFAKKEIEHVNLLVDISGSMSTSFGSTTRITAAKRAVDQIVRSSSKKRTNFSLILFDHQASLEMPQTDKFIKLLMLEFNSQGGTDLLEGLKLAYEQEPNRIIILTDGHTCYPSECLNFVERNLSRGIKIDTVAIGEANDNLLQKLASMTGGTFYRAESPELLEQHYNKLETQNYLRLEHHRGESQND